MYILVSSFSKSPKIAKPHFEAHCVWLHKYITEGIFIASGPKKSNLGGAILVRSIDKEQLKRILEEDSYMQAGVANYLIVDVDFKLASSGFEKLIGY